MATRQRDEIALGYRHHLLQFVALTSASPYWSWHQDGLTGIPTNSVRTFEQAFREAARNATRIHFNLDGIPDPNAAADLGLIYGFVYGNLTDAELQLIRSSPDLHHETVFYRQGKPVASPFP